MLLYLQFHVMWNTSAVSVRKLIFNLDYNLGFVLHFEQFLEVGFFHADPHHGNLVATADGSLTYLILV